MTNIVRRRVFGLFVAGPLLVCLASGPSAGAVQDRPMVPIDEPVQVDDPVGVYGRVRRVVFEPATGQPERMQVWGHFAVALPDDTAGYHVPEAGYLYLQLPSDPAPALAEWQELKRLEVAGFKQVNFVGTMIRGRVAFGSRGALVRVRTTDEPLVEPDTYLAGNGVAMVPLDTTMPGARAGWDGPKPASRTHYALVDRVVLEPAVGPPQRMQVWGRFALGQRNAAAYAAAREGYLYFTLPPDRPSAHEVWFAAAGTGQPLKFFFVEYHRLDVRLRPASETPRDPDAYTPIWTHVHRARSDSRYGPIRSLYALR